ncbi:hypothetical protein AAH979_15605 [Plantactinospora sp. ZYX-F-223]|uniref:hypothetical protein n=1 Tax=Plantactinospora sp. ZYX-F-223 TaxID=3144103 RepID=UPI0031FBD754
MRDAATPPDDGHDAAPDGSPTTPQQRAAAIRAAAGEVLARVQEWRNSPHWREDETNRRRYQITVDAIASLDRLPDPEPQETVLPLVDAIGPVLAAWRPSRPGPEQAILFTSSDCNA